MKLIELLDKIPYRLTGNANFDYGAAEVKRVTAQADRADEHTLFVCARSVVRDGHLTAAAAYAKGCRLFLAERDLHLPDDAAVLSVKECTPLLGPLAAACLGHPARQMTVLGITGTRGKSSVAYLTAALLRGAGHRTGLWTTDGLYMQGQLRPMGDLLPDAAQLQELLLEMVQAGNEFAVLELPSYMLADHVALCIPFTAVLLTNLLPERRRPFVHKDPAAYTAAKASLFASDAAFYVLPANFVGFASMGKGRILTFGEGGDYSAAVCGEQLRDAEIGSRLLLREKGGDAHALSLPTPGKWAVENALAATALARIAGVPMPKILRILSRYTPPGRLECVPLQQGCRVYIDSAYSAEDLEAVLQTLRGCTVGRLAVVIGSVGGRAKERRAPLGEVATRCADRVYFTADDPDCENPSEIAREMAAGAAYPDRYRIVADRREAILLAVRELRPGDVLLLSGKGDEESQLIRGRREPFSERAIVREAMGYL